MSINSLFRFKVIISTWICMYSCGIDLFAQKYLPFTNVKSETKHYKECIQSGASDCRLNLRDYKGLAFDFNTFASFPIGAYYNSGKRAAGFGFGGGVEYMPINKVPITVLGNFAFHFSDIRNYYLDIPVQISSPFYNEEFVIPAQVNLKNRIGNMNIGLRFWMPSRKIHPYFIAMVGFVSSATVIKVYNENALVLAGLKNEELIYSESVGNGSYGSLLYGGGIAFDADYNITCDLRVSVLNSRRFSYIAAENFDDWVFDYQQTVEEFDAENFQVDQLNLNLKRTFSPLELLLISFNVTVFVR